MNPQGLSSELPAGLPQRVNAVDAGPAFMRMEGFSRKYPKQVTEVYVYLTSDVPRGVRGRLLRTSGCRTHKAAPHG
jgi:hypothetical protein